MVCLLFDSCNTAPVIADVFLITVLREKLYMDITVTDIVTRAGVARASFYRNFNSINDVIDAISDEMSSEFIEDISPLGKWG